MIMPNEHDALNVYGERTRSFSTRPNDRLAVIESVKKLQELGFVDFVANLNVEEKALILKSDVRYFIPWRAVSEHALSTSLRCVARWM